MRSTVLILIALLLSSCQEVTQELVVYTSRNEHLIKDIFEQYEKETGVKIRYRTGEAGALIQALRSEGQNTSADIFMTVDAGNLWFAKEQGLLAPIESESINQRVPKYLRDKDNYWAGLSVRARTIVYSTDRVSPEELSTYEDLASPKWQGRLCLRTSRKVYNQSLIAMFIHELGLEKTLQVIKGWVENSVDIFSNDTAVLKAIAAGQCDVGIVNSYYFGRLIYNEGEQPLDIFWPNQVDSYGVHINISGAGIVRHSSRQEQALHFLEWLSHEAQKSFAQINFEHTVKSDYKIQHPIVQSWGTFKPNSNFDLSLSGQAQNEVMQIIHDAGYR